MLEFASATIISRRRTPSEQLLAWIVASDPSLFQDAVWLYDQASRKDPALARRFVPVLVKEPNADEAVHMLRQIMPAYADHHGIGYTDGALGASVELSPHSLREGQ